MRAQQRVTVIKGKLQKSCSFLLKTRTRAGKKKRKKKKRHEGGCFGGLQCVLVLNAGIRLGPGPYENGVYTLERSVIAYYCVFSSRRVFPVESQSMLDGPHRDLRANGRFVG